MRYLAVVDALCSDGSSGARMLTEQVPSGGVIWVVGGSHAPIDMAEVVLMTQRSDVLVQGVAGIANAWSARADLDATGEGVVLLGDLRSGPLSERSWPAFVGMVKDLGGNELLRVGQLGVK